ncbi:MAG: FumA C-terminus/TtdB family hydratase beta subunit [Planctomycetota bacterium]|jgi:fumarate hydratase subunit beta
MAGPVRITPPLDEEALAGLRAGTRVLITGELIGARDQAHLLMNEALAKGDQLPFDPDGAVIYYVGPAPGGEGRPVGAAGPTTSARMDSVCGPLFKAGVKATIGKGPRTPPAKDAMRRSRAVYLAATGGAGALLGACIERAEVLAYADLGTGALWRLAVRDFPAVVAIDTEGHDLFEEGPAQFRR